MHAQQFIFQSKESNCLFSIHRVSFGFRSNVFFTFILSFHNTYSNVLKPHYVYRTSLWLKSINQFVLTKAEICCDWLWTETQDSLWQSTLTWGYNGNCWKTFCYVIGPKLNMNSIWHQKNKYSIFLFDKW